MLNEPHIPSLCHPLYSSTARRGDGPPIPAFPEIRSGWDGVCLSHLHWVGINERIFAARSTQEFNLITLHEEGGHFLLSDALLNRIIRLHLIRLLMEIHDLVYGKGSILVNGQIEKAGRLTGRVPVPLGATEQPTVVLEWLWRRIGHLFFISGTVEEVFAVWRSLSEAQKGGLLSSRRKEALVEWYKKQYSPRYRHFIEVYDKFSEVAQIVDPGVAYTLVYKALSTLFPTKALLDMIDMIQQLPIHGQPLDDIDFVHEMCAPIVMDYCSSSSRDHLGAHFSLESEFMEAMEEPEYLPMWKGQPEEPLYFNFNHQRIKFFLPKTITINEGRFFNFLWLESIRQQLTTGRGLICPFWWPDAWPEGECCNKENRLWLEGIWNHTQGSRKTWQPQGCLKAVPVR